MKTRKVTLIAPAKIAGVDYAAGDTPEVTADQHDELAARGCVKPRGERAAEPKNLTQETDDA